MTVINVVEYLSVQAREPSRAGSRAYIEPSRASSSSSRSDRAEPGSARYSTEPHRAEPSLARLGSFPALINSADRPIEKQAPSETRRGPSGLRRRPSGRHRTEKPEGDGFGKMNYSVLADRPRCTTGPSATAFI
jgi:hypothetical protein